MEPRITATRRGRLSRKEVARRVRSERNLKLLQQSRPELFGESTSPVRRFFGLGPGPSEQLQRFGAFTMNGFHDGFEEADRLIRLKKKAVWRKTGKKMSRARLIKEENVLLQLAKDVHFEKVRSLREKASTRVFNKRYQDDPDW